jgi:hypothetical protein
MAEVFTTKPESLLSQLAMQDPLFMKSGHCYRNKKNRNSRSLSWASVCEGLYLASIMNNPTFQML